ncbi:gamma carbonic anhydrase family protein [Halogeometricum borinquense]|uniref:Gamma carbonic anhydrase family protein n=1 Tax=Halogeometricum borinquense TaxID=60847 RepID=A0A482T0Q7_9EURY|nr:gamma carbonic anhydrase family protein [Halogeometricum borinquense]RYJ08526.1 gamma carbonic anhydrase family protein [Halogeometricum borinquense]
MNDPRIYEFEGDTPTIDADAHVSQMSTLVGDVRVAANASVWPGVVLRGDIGSVRIGAESHVADNAVLHASTIGNRVMVGHGSVLNEAVVEDSTLIGFNATINTDVTVGERSIVAAGCVVPEGRDIPPESFVRGVPAEVTPLSEAGIDIDELLSKYSATEYTELAERHAELFE